MSQLLLVREGSLVTAWHPMGVPVGVAAPDIEKVVRAMGHADRAFFHGAISLEEEGLTALIEPYEWSVERPLPNLQELYVDWHTPSARYKLYKPDGNIVKVERLSWQRMVEGFSPHSGCCRLLAHTSNNDACRPCLREIEMISPALFTRVAMGLHARRVPS